MGGSSHTIGFAGLSGARKPVRLMRGASTLVKGLIIAVINPLITFITATGPIYVDGMHGGTWSDASGGRPYRRRRGTCQAV
jgi:hypothetical protein